MRESLQIAILGNAGDIIQQLGNSENNKTKINIQFISVLRNCFASSTTPSMLMFVKSLKTKMHQ